MGRSKAEAPSPLAATLKRSVAIANRHPRLRINRRAVQAFVVTLDADFRVRPGDRAHLVRPTGSPFSAGSVPPGELSLVFLTDQALARLHADYMNDPSTTDVITFEGDFGLGGAGEICVSVDTAATYAREHGRDFASELTLYVIHGWLHLAGYDDLSPARKRVMRRAEQRALRLLAALRPAPAAFRLKRSASRRDN